MTIFCFKVQKLNINVIFMSIRDQVIQRCIQQQLGRDRQGLDQKQTPVQQYCATLFGALMDMCQINGRIWRNWHFWRDGEHPKKFQPLITNLSWKQYASPRGLRHSLHLEANNSGSRKNSQSFRVVHHRGFVTHSVTKSQCQQSAGNGSMTAPGPGLSGSNSALTAC